MHHYQIADTEEPVPIGIAPMAEGVYEVGDEITIAIVFNEIVDDEYSAAAGLSADSELTTNWSWADFKYAGGAGTNVLYFTGTVTEYAQNTLSVFRDRSTAFEQVRDMSSGTSEIETVDETFTTTVQVSTDSTSPTAHAGDISNDNGSLSATVSSTTAAKLEYAWSEADDPAAVTSWQIAGASSDSAPISGTVTAARTDGTWYLHVRATSETGLTAYDFSSIDLGTPDNPAVVVPTLTATVDNNGWVKARTIQINRKPINTGVTIKKPDGMACPHKGNYKF